jgi:hypothetical protein
MVRRWVLQINIQMCYTSTVGVGGTKAMSVINIDCVSFVRQIVMWGESSLSGKNLW